jgi:microcin C transport system permease protein
MTGYIARRILLMFPTLLGILFVSFIVVQFAPGGPVERVLAQLSGSDTGGSSRGFGRRGRFRPARSGRRSADAASSSKYRGAQGLDPDSSKSWKRSSDSTSRRQERFALMVWNFSRFDFGKSYFRDVSVIQLIKEKLPVSMSLGIWMMLLTYLISIPLGIRKAVQDGSKFDTWTSAVIIIGLCDPGIPVRDPVDHPVRRRLVPQHLPAARPDFRRLGAVSPGTGRSSTISGTSRCRWSRWRSARSPP